MNIFGVGLYIMLPSIVAWVAIFVASVLYPEVGIFSAINPLLTLGIGALLAVLGFVQLFVSGRTFLEGRRKGKLVTKGPFAKCRNPIYSAWIVWIFPALAIAFRMPYLMLVSLLAFVLLRIFIGREEKALEAQFGSAYIKYRQATPLVRWWLL